MSDTMHLLIAHARSASPQCRPPLQDLQFPALSALLTQLKPAPLERLPDEAFDTPVERASARALGLAAPDGRIPWAARQAAHRELPPRDAAWAWLTPCHFEVGMSEVRLSGTTRLTLPDAQAQALAQTMAPYFAEDGVVLQAFADGHWLAHGEVFRDLATASPARVAGEDLNPWLPASPLLRRLLNEMQMLLYTHPVNDERGAQGQAPINGLWVSGCGAWPANAPVDAAAPTVVLDLQDAALQEDWPAWAQAWQQVDAQHCAPLLARQRQGLPVALTLCGERSSQSFHSAPRSAWSRLTSLWRKPRLADLLGTP